MPVIRCVGPLRLCRRLALGALVTASPLVTEAQTIRGQVIDSLSGRTVGAGFVVLLDEDGREMFRALSDATGRFAIQAAEGVYRLRSERIGYRAWVSPPFTLRPGETLERDIVIATIPTQLSAIRVTGSDRCRQSASDAENTATVWEEARKALAAATWTLDRELFRYALTMYDRDLDRLGRRVGREQYRRSEGFTRVPFRSSRTAYELAAQGYILEHEDGSWTYEAPDANVLLSDAFLGTHCLSVVRTRDDDTRIGVAFEPIDGDGRADIRGTLWLDEASAELRRLEYEYTELPYGVRSRQVGGDIEFMRVTSGAWVIRRWEIRMPKIELRRTRYRDDPSVFGIHAAGGRVVGVTTPTGAQIYSVASTLEGTVYDSTRMRPLAGARITVVGTPDTATADRRGRFRLISNVGGERAIALRHPRLDSVGFAFPDIPFELVRGDTVTIPLAVPSLATIRAVLCTDSTDDREPRIGRVLFGFVRDRAGNPVAEAVMTLDWEIGDPGSGRPVRADHRGWYVACGFPLNREVTVRARDGGGQTGLVRVRFTSRGVVVNGGPERRLEVPLFRKDLRLMPARP